MGSSGNRLPAILQILGDFGFQKKKEISITIPVSAPHRRVSVGHSLRDPLNALVLPFPSFSNHPFYLKSSAW
jgi:hypothetical protein